MFGSRYYHSPQPAWREHICGLYYVIPYNGYLQKHFLPQVELQAHATILSTTSRTVLTQTFVNPSTEKGVREVRYTFPLYDGVSVVGFTCHVADRTIIGEVKEREKARTEFKEAIERGETAGLFEQLPDASDVFTTTVGNIPPGARVIIKITYLGELKHDMEVDGIRFTIPNVISPRYGSYPGTLLKTSATDAQGSKISITVDAEMADGSFIQKIQSPSHPIAITMGTTTFAPNADPTMSKASATLTSGSVELDTDFVLQVTAKNTGVPKAVLENHSTIPNQRALMATLVPKFTLPPEKPEIVFVCDRSGSMSGTRITLVVQALKVFLKSLPVGVKFNICSFGSMHTFLWKKSVTYSQQTLDEAVRHAESFTANYGGTEMLAPLKSTIEQRYKDMPLDVMMLTDGEIWDQTTLFEYLNKSVSESKAPIRIFTLGIGNGVSHALIEGVAKAGNGFSQTVGEGEKMDTKVVRMLKGALSPHVNDYTLEVKYKSDTATSEEEDDFEIVEKVADSLKIKLDIGDEKEKPVGFQSKTIRAFFTNPTQKKIISLFNTSADPDKEEPPAYDETGEERYAHLPKVPVPKILQAPQNIPPLFAFNRTTVYLLLGPDAPQATPKSVVLRGSSAHGPLELEIPIQVLELPGETIHQLAAKKAIAELEQGRGWLPEAKNESGKLIKTKFEGRFPDMVEREAVRLGVQFQVGGKWCSFVAVESNRKNLEGKEKGAPPEWEWLEDEAPTQESDQRKETLPRGNQSLKELESKRKKSGSGAPPSGSIQGQVYATNQYLGASIQAITTRGERLDSLAEKSDALSASATGFRKSAARSQSRSLFGGIGGLFGSTGSPSQMSAPAPSFSPFGASNSGGFGAAQAAAAPSPKGGLFGMDQRTAATSATPPPPAFGSAPVAPLAQATGSNAMNSSFGQPYVTVSSPLFGGGAQAPMASLFGSAAPPPPPSGASPIPSPTSPAYSARSSPGTLRSRRTSPKQVSAKTLEELLHYLVSLQTFEGSWEWNDNLIATLVASLSLNQALITQEAAASSNEKHLATSLVIAVFEEKLASFQGSWELVVDKARAWLEGEVLELEDIMQKARKLVM